MTLLCKQRWRSLALVTPLTLAFPSPPLPRPSCPLLPLLLLLQPSACCLQHNLFLPLIPPGAAGPGLRVSCACASGSRAAPPRCPECGGASFDGPPLVLPHQGPRGQACVLITSKQAAILPGEKNDDDTQVAGVLAFSARPSQDAHAVLTSAPWAPLQGGRGVLTRKRSRLGVSRSLINWFALHMARMKIPRLIDTGAG